MSNSNTSSDSTQSSQIDPTKTHLAHSLQHEQPLLSCRYNPEGTVLVAGSQDRHVVRWDLSSDSKTVLKAHESWVRDLAFSPDCNTLLTTGYDGQLIWWDAAPSSDKPIRAVKAHEGWVRVIDVSRDGQLVATGGNDKLVNVYRLATGELVQQFTGHTSHVYQVLFHPDEHVLLSGELNGEICQWNLADGSLQRTFDATALATHDASQRVDYGGVRTLAISPDRKWLAAGGLHKATNPLGNIQEPLVLMFDWNSGEQKQALSPAEMPNHLTSRLLYHRDGLLIAVVGGNSGHLVFWKEREAKPVHKHKVGLSAYDGDLHPDGLHIATAHHDGKVIISRMAAEEES